MVDTRQLILNRLILLQCRQGKVEGFETLVRSWEDSLFYYVLRMVQREEDAWDVLQEVWLRAFRGIRSVRQPEALGSWLYRIARNCALTHIERTPRWDPLDEEIDIPAAEPDELPMDLTPEQIHGALDRLPVAEREVLTLHFLEGYLVSEIADVVGAPLGTVKSRMARAKVRMRAILEKEGSRP